MLTETGLLIIASPYTWKAEHTHPDSWIGGRLNTLTTVTLILNLTT